MFQSAEMALGSLFGFLRYGRQKLLAFVSNASEHGKTYDFDGLPAVHSKLFPNFFHNTDLDIIFQSDFQPHLLSTVNC